MTANFTKAEIEILVRKYSIPFAEAFACFVAKLESACQQPEIGQEFRLAPELLESVSREIQQNLENSDVETVEFSADSAAAGLANRLRRVARERNVTQKELAARLKVTPSFISKVLRNPDRSRLQTLRRISEALGIKLAEVL